jgi:hypothetical protein
MPRLDSKGMVLHQQSRALALAYRWRKSPFLAEQAKLHDCNPHDHRPENNVAQFT